MKNSILLVDDKNWDDYGLFFYISITVERQAVIFR